MEKLPVACSALDEPKLAVLISATRSTSERSSERRPVRRSKYRNRRVNELRRPAVPAALVHSHSHTIQAARLDWKDTARACSDVLRADEKSVNNSSSSCAGSCLTSIAPLEGDGSSACRPAVSTSLNCVVMDPKLSIGRDMLAPSTVAAAAAISTVTSRHVSTSSSSAASSTLAISSSSSSSGGGGSGSSISVGHLDWSSTDSNSSNDVTCGLHRYMEQLEGIANWKDSHDSVLSLLGNMMEHVSAMLPPNSNEGNPDPEHEELQHNIKQEMKQIKDLLEDYVSLCSPEQRAQMLRSSGAADIFRELGL